MGHLVDGQGNAIPGVVWLSFYVGIILLGQILFSKGGLVLLVALCHSGFVLVDAYCYIFFCPMSVQCNGQQIAK